MKKQLLFHSIFLTSLTLAPSGLRAQAEAEPPPSAPAVQAQAEPLPVPAPLPPTDRPDRAIQPFGTEADLNSAGHQFVLLKNWTFGNNRMDATVKARADLDREFYYRYIYENGKLDKLSTYWSVHRDYPENDAKSLHVLEGSSLVLKGRVLPGGGLKDRGLESGMLRGKVPITAGMFIEMRCKVPTGVGSWPAFWLNGGVQNPDNTFSSLGWPPEIDIFEFFNWNGRPTSRIMECNVQVNGKPEKYGNPRTIFQSPKFEKNYPNKGFDTGTDCSEDYHVYALDWRKNEPIWLFDGKPIKQAYYEWPGPPAHVLVTNQLGMQNMGGTNISQMKADEKNWNFVIDYIRIWERKAL